MGGLFLYLLIPIFILLWFYRYYYKAFDSVSFRVGLSVAVWGSLLALFLGIFFRVAYDDWPGIFLMIKWERQYFSLTPGYGTLCRYFVYWGLLASFVTFCTRRIGRMRQVLTLRERLRNSKPIKFLHNILSDPFYPF